MYICICNAVTERDIDHCVNRCGACSLEDLQRELGVAAGCGCCRETAQAVLAGRAHSSQRMAESL
jgi:bacterioferritin-associated ferredoxin